jgi:hypothetical protein
MLGVYRAVCPTTAAVASVANATCNNFGGCAVATSEKATIDVVDEEVIIVRWGTVFSTASATGSLVISCTPTTATMAGAVDSMPQETSSTVAASVAESSAGSSTAGSSWSSLVPPVTVIPPPPPPDAEGLSSTATVAIAVGVPIVATVLLTAAVVALCIIHRRNELAAAQEMRTEMAPMPAAERPALSSPPPPGHEKPAAVSSRHYGSSAPAHAAASARSHYDSFSPAEVFGTDAGAGSV